MVNIRRWIAAIVAALKRPSAHFSRPEVSASVNAATTHSASAAETHSVSAVETHSVSAVETHSVSAATTPIETAPVTDAITADPAIRQDDLVSHTTSLPPDQQEIHRRRDLVRALFNDFWTGRYDKPTAFVDRLNEAENYLNERLAACGEVWQLDAKTRKMLGLPPGSNVLNKGDDPTS
jgi:hypothetical protein